MRSERLSYTATPAGTAKALNKKPRQKKPKKEINQLMLILFFIVLPVLGLLAFFFQPFRYIFIAASVISMLVMWLLQSFKLPGRLILTGLYGLLCVITLVSALNQQHRQSANLPQLAMLTPTPEVTSTPSFAAIAGTMGTDVPPDFYVADDDLEALNSLESVGLSGGVDESVEAQAQSQGYVSAVKSGAEIALENFMENGGKPSLLIWWNIRPLPGAMRSQTRRSSSFSGNSPKDRCWNGGRCLRRLERTPPMPERLP